MRLMNSQSVIQNFLMNRLVEAQKRNPSFSVRSLAKKADVSISVMSEILRGKRVVTRKTAERIADRFLLDPSERFELLRFFPEKKKSAKSTREMVKDEMNRAAPLKGELLNYVKLSADQFQTISHWLHFAILSLMQTRNFRSDPSFISDRLGTSVREVNLAIERLVRMGLIEETSKGLKRKTVKLSTTDNLFDVSIQRAHLADLERGRAAIEEVPVELRDFTSITFPANPEKMKKAQEIIRRAQQEVVNLMADDEAEEVYRLCSMMIPLTQITKSEKKK
jgi:uncharacterized protein (TIGR02147 family)